MAAKGNGRLFTVNEVTTMTRLALARATQQQVSNLSDIYDACKYPEQIDNDDFHRMYEREGVASKVVDIWPEECWERAPLVYEDGDAAVETAAEEALEALIDELDVFGVCLTADKESGIGRYGVVYFSLSDATTVDDLAKAPVGWPEGYDYSRIEKGLPPEGATVQPYKVQFLRVLPEKYAKVLSTETNPLSPRYGWPLTYQLTFAGDITQSVTQTVDASSYTVHWTRVLHIVDNKGTNPIVGRPRQQRCYNRLIDLTKAYGGSGQGLWNGGFPGTSFEVAPGFEDAEMSAEDEADVKAQLRDYVNGFQRWIFTKGLKANQLSNNITNPGPFIEAYLQNVGLSIGVPWRKLLGSEQGQLASGEDGETWDDRVQARCEGHCTRNILRPILWRLVWFGAVPVPKELHIDWPTRSEPKPSEQALTAKTLTEAMAAYVSGNVSQLLSPALWLEMVAKFSAEDVALIEEDSKSFTDFNAAADLKTQSAQAALEAAQNPAPPAAPPGKQPPGKQVAPTKAKEEEK